MRRRFFIFLLPAVCAVMPAIGPPVHPEPLTLRPEGPPRRLQAPVFGVSTAEFDRYLNNPAEMSALRTLAIGLVRFPGGSESNFYNWRTGLIEVHERPDSSPYMRFWVKAAARLARGRPEGVTLEQYANFSRQIGAHVILVPNFETSSVAEQVEWFKRLAQAGVVPERIELGNEYWVAMGNDPASLARWPDEPTSMRIMKRYVDALRPYFPPHAKLAVQSAAGAADTRRGRAGQRLEQWDENLRPEPWFDAVTVHIYPRLRNVMGDPEAGGTLPTPENALPRLRAMTARVDEGVERILQSVEQRLPGKEIWVTEWNARGANPTAERSAHDAEPMSPRMEMLATTRMALVYLGHPSVTASLYFRFDFNAGYPHAMFVSDGQGGYAPLPTAAALGWLNQAANAGGTFQRVVQAGARLVAGGGARRESYLAVEGGLFQAGRGATLILENVSGGTLSFDPATLLPDRHPSKVEVISVPDLSDTTKRPARISGANTEGIIAIAPFSVLRIVWE